MMLITTRTFTNNTTVLPDIKPRLTLVGAGPGDAELLTIKGLKALKTADVVLYDALVNVEILDFAPTNAIKIFVGKRNRQHSYSQTQINNMIVEHARAHGHVVRLKGGDSFVFGRGAEELNHVRSFGIECVIIPGISSAISVAALAGIPVTHRGSSESFWVLTTTTQAGTLCQDLHLAAQSNATIVILMGLGKITEIVQLFCYAGKANTSIAIIQNGSLPNQNIIISNIETILEIIQNIDKSSPSIIIIGDVVNQCPSAFLHLHELQTC